MRMRWYFLFFLVSGFCSLVYEVVWLRLSMAMFGITTPMVSIVLSVFMTGLGLGSWGGGSLVRKLKVSDAAKALRLYGLTEILIGISGLVVPLLLSWGHGILLNLGRQLVWNSSAYYLTSGLWVAISLLPWCTCMGATIPFAMAAMRMTAGDESQRSFSYLYLANVLGAIFGTLVPAFLLIEMLGFRGTLHVASSLNGILASAVFLLSFRSTISAAQAPTSQTSEPRTRLYNLSQSSVLWLLFTTGVCSMAMEIVWIRLFTLYLGNVVYAFAAILALYLGATFVGSRAYRWWSRSYDLNDTAFLWAVLGLTAVLPLLCASPSLPLPVLRHESQFALGAVRAAFGIVPFSAILGFLTPMLVDYWSGGDPDRGGRAYAVNVLGAILGPLVAGFWILPWLGDRWGLCVMSLPLFLIGLLISLREDALKAEPQTSLRARGLYAGVVLLSIPLVTMTKGIGQKDPHHIERRDYTATVIATGSGMEKQVLVNGIGMTVLTPVTKFMGHMPLAFLNRHPENGLAICFGMGTTFRSILSWGIDTTVVELVPSVPKVFGYFHSDGPELLKSPRAHVVIDDGRRFLERSTEKYDVITLDPPPPVGAPTSSLLYSREFYTIVKNHLRPGALVQVWLPGKDPGTHAAVAKALSDSFPYVRVFESLEGQEGQGFHFLASADAAIPEMSASQLASRLPLRAAADFVEWGPYKTPEEMFAAFLRGERPLASFVAEYPSVPPIDDDQPINEYFFLRWNFHYYR